jgi:hypothetical protein
MINKIAKILPIIAMTFLLFDTARADDTPAAVELVTKNYVDTGIKTRLKKPAVEGNAGQVLTKTVGGLEWANPGSTDTSGLQPKMGDGTADDTTGGTTGSNKAITSGAVRAGLDLKQDKIIGAEGNVVMIAPGGSGVTTIEVVNLWKEID